MKSRQKKLTARKAAGRITGTLWEYLQKLPAKERRKRLDAAHKSMKSKLASAKHSSVASETDRKHAGRSPSVPLPFAVRSGR